MMRETTQEWQERQREEQAEREQYDREHGMGEPNAVPCFRCNTTMYEEHADPKENVCSSCRSTNGRVEYLPVESSNIKAIGFDPYVDDATMGTLLVHFLNGAQFAYYQCPADVFAGFRDAPSKGKYYFANVKGKYETEKLREADKVVLSGGMRAGRVGIDLAKPGSDRTVRTFNCTKCGGSWQQGQQHQCRMMQAEPQQDAIRFGTIDF